MSFYYEFTRCDDSSVKNDWTFPGNPQLTLLDVYSIYGYCWQVTAQRNSGQQVAYSSYYGLNGCSQCTAPTPTPGPVTSYAWQFNAVQGNGSFVKPTVCVNAPVTVYSDVQDYASISCGT